MEQKTCAHCNNDFTVEADDLEFYKKISPTFDGKQFLVPSPSLCPDCREIRRLSWRNERSLYKRKSDKSGQEIVSMFSPDKTDLKVYSVAEWWADDWDAKDFGRDFEPSKSVIDQIKNLYYAVPHSALMNVKTEECEFSNFILDCKNCYMCTVCYYETENTHYSWGAYYDKDCVDILLCDHCEKCYRLVASNGCYNCSYAKRLLNCRDCKFCVDLVGCSDCFMSSNLAHKQYFFKNKQLTKEEYKEKIKRYNFGSRKQIGELSGEYKTLCNNSFVKFAKIVNCENCQGDDLVNCKNAQNCFSQVGSENVKFSYRGREMHDAQDFMGGSVDTAYDSVIIGWGNNYLFCADIEYSSNLVYCISCYHSKDCFGCVGLRNKQFYIFNKQMPSKEVYEERVAEIIDKMQQDNEWGEFFPFGMSPFGFNETLGHSYFPLTKDEALSYGLKWQDSDFSTQYQGEFYEPEDDIAAYINDDGKRRKLLSSPIKCEISGKAFKIMPQELAFYLDQKIPIPVKHYDIRYTENLNQANPKKLWKRECMCEQSGHNHDGKCQVKFQTPYSSDRPEKIYCEQCYQGSIE